MTEDLLERLARDAVPQAREAAATQGFFSAIVDMKLDRSTTPVTVRIVVTPGLPPPSASVAIDVDGPANDTPQGTRGDRASCATSGCCRSGATFQQETWTTAKNARGGHARRKPVCGCEAHRERGAASTRRERAADLSVTLDSGPAFTIGSIEVQGLSRYTPEMIENFSNVRPGDLYSERVARRLRAAPPRLGLLRERAGVDRHRSRAGRRREGDALGDRGAARSASSSAWATPPTPNSARAVRTAT